jgi:tetratricopeptide (TPR) repeat protein
MPFAEDAWAYVQRELDRYAGSWVGMHREACEATRIRKEQSEALLDLRMACLERRRVELASLVGVLAAADRKVVENAATAVAGQTPVDGCADAAALTARDRLPSDPEHRQQVEAIQVELAQVKALRDAGKLRDALPRTEAAVEKARALGHAPTLAKALEGLGNIHQQMVQPQLAEAAYRETIVAALDGHDAERLARACTHLVYVVGVDESRVEEGAHWAEYAHAAIRALGPGHVPLQALLLSNEGAVAVARGDNAEAIRLYEAALILVERAEPEGLNTAHRMYNVAVACYRNGDYARSAELLRKVAAIYQKTFGQNHVLYATVLGTEGSIVKASGKLEEALQLQTRARAILERTVGVEDVSVADVVQNQADTLFRLGRLDEAMRAVKQAFDVYERLAPRSIAMAGALETVAEIHIAQGQNERAVEVARKASALLADLAGRDHPARAEPLALEAGAQLAAGRPDRALAPAEEALAIREKAKVNPGEQADAEFAVARALADLKRDRARATALAQSALERYRDQGAGYEKEAREVEAWLASRRDRQ